ncbi:Crp/Fnr family transcriptional regulator [Sphingobacterium sp. UGAL515B_05]|uniref:Crp/Fnr family transcriptional regulator n=1 Tax=Sphingobacterium sp. UGAL515B_05 TaxID=2986767 RepID=UPI002953706F|nr:cyclic nucleotide-binding domain-containing protein [Sphingobacterium sp. UGAL515B_05]WON93091.1 Crp/Fnr family transcriptional regulator [Sphingobacterium sp. UGAL515B_05]
MHKLFDLISPRIFKKEISFRRNEYIKMNGSIDSKIYFIKKGSIKISIFQEDHEQIIRFGYDGDLIVAMDSFIHGSYSDYAIQAIKKTDMLIAEKEDFMNFIYSSSENTKLYITILEQLVLQQLEREQDLLLESPKNRYERLIKRNSRLFQLIPNKYIANYLRMSPETLSRISKS